MVWGHNRKWKGHQQHWKEEAGKLSRRKQKTVKSALKRSSTGTESCVLSLCYYSLRFSIGIPLA